MGDLSKSGSDLNNEISYLLLDSRIMMYIWFPVNVSQASACNIPNCLNYSLILCITVEHAHNAHLTFFSPAYSSIQCHAS